MTTDDQKLIAKIQHFFDFMKHRKQEVEDSIITKSPLVIRHLNEAYEDLQEEYLETFQDFIYQK